MNSKEAWEHVQSGGVVTSGGYTYYKDGYFAFGTYPGCKRGGNISEMSFEGKEWTPLSEIDIVCEHGYKPEPFVKRIANKDSLAVGWIEALRDYLEERMLVCDYANPMKNSELCRKFFKEIEEN